MAAIKQLSPSYRKVLHLRFFEHMSYTGMAAMTQSTPNAMRTRFHRAKKSLYECMLDS